MKKWTLLIALAVGFSSAPAFAHDDQYEHRSGYADVRRDQVDWHLDHLNRMLAHVRWELSRYRGDWRLRREVGRISSEVSRINWCARHGWEGWRTRREVERLHNELHRIEEQLHVRRGDWYRWQ